MKGMTIESLMKHKPLIPLYVCTAIGMFGAAFYTMRLALRNPDVQWVNKGEISNQEFSTKQYKFYSPNIDYSTLESPAPKY